MNNKNNDLLPLRGGGAPPPPPPHKKPTTPTDLQSLLALKGILAQDPETQGGTTVRGIEG